MHNVEGEHYLEYKLIKGKVVTLQICSFYDPLIFSIMRRLGNLGSLKEDQTREPNCIAVVHLTESLEYNLL